MRFKLMVIYLLIQCNVGLTSDYNIENVHWRLKPLIKNLLDEPNLEKNYNAVYTFWKVKENEEIGLPELSESSIEYFDDNKSPLYILHFYYNLFVGKNIKNSKLTYSLLKQTAENGWSEAQYQLSKFYNRIKQDRTEETKQKRRQEEEKYWLEKAGKSGNEKANAELSRQYLDRIEKEYNHDKNINILDFKKQLKHLNIICNAEYSDRNDTTKFIWLAKLYCLGMGTYPDWIEAYKLISKAKNLFGIKIAVLDMEERFPKSHQSFLESYIDKKAYQEINTLYDWLVYHNISTNNDNPLAQYFLGQVYSGFIQYVKEDVNEAIRYFRQAHDNKFLLATIRLGIIYGNKALSTTDPIAMYNSFNQALEYFLAAKSNATNNDESNRFQRYMDDISTNIHQLEEKIPELKKNAQRSKRLTELNNKRIDREENRKKSAQAQNNIVKSAEQIKQQDEELFQLFRTEQSRTKSRNKNNNSQKSIQNNKQKTKENPTVGDFKNSNEAQVLSLNATYQPPILSKSSVPTEFSKVDTIVRLEVSEDAEDENGWIQQKSRKTLKREAEQRRRYEAEKSKQEQALTKQQAAKLKREKALRQKQAQTPVYNKLSKQEHNVIKQATQQDSLNPTSSSKQMASSQQRTVLQERNFNIVGKNNVVLNSENDNSKVIHQEQEDDPLVVIGSVQDKSKYPPGNVSSITPGNKPSGPQALSSSQLETTNTAANPYESNNTTASLTNVQIKQTWNGTKILSRPTQEFGSDNSVPSVIKQSIEQENSREKFNLDFNTQEMFRLYNESKMVASQIESETDPLKRVILHKKLDEIQTKILNVTNSITRQNAFLLKSNIDLREQNFKRCQKEFPQYK